MATIVKLETPRKTATGGKAMRIRYKAIVRRPAAGVPLLTRTFIRYDAANEWARGVEADIQRGSFQKKAATCPALGAALDRYEKEITPQKRSATSERSLLHIIRDDAADLLGVRLDNVTAADLSGLRDRWVRDGVTASTIRRRLALLSHLYRVARIDWGVTGLVNPVADVRQPKVRDARARRVDNAEIEAVCAATESPELAAFVRLAVTTTMRRGEMRSLRWEDVNLPDRTAWLPSGVTKGSKGRFVPLSKAAVTVLKGINPRKAGRVFRFDAHTYTRAWRRAVDRARAHYVEKCEARDEVPDPHFLVDLRLHDLRHEGASRYADKHFSTVELAAITGHKDLKMLKRYTHPDARKLAKRMG